MNGEHPGHYLTAYALGNLSEAGRREVEGHVAGCPACAEELAALRASAGLLQGALGDPEPKTLQAKRMQSVLIGTPARRLSPVLWFAGCGVAILTVVAILSSMGRGMDYARESAAGPPRGEVDYNGDADHSGLIGKFGGRSVPKESTAAAPEPAAPPSLASREEWKKSEALESDHNESWKEDSGAGRPARVEPPQDPGVDTNVDRPRHRLDGGEGTAGKIVEDERRANQDRAMPGTKDLAPGEPHSRPADDGPTPPRDATGRSEELQPEEERELTFTSPKGTASALLNGSDARVRSERGSYSHHPFLEEGESSLEPRLRAYTYYKTLDPTLAWERFRSSDLAVPAPSLADEGLGRDAFKQRYGCDPFFDTSVDRLSTFGMDVDTASFTRARALLRQGQLPDPKQVRVEEFVNYFGDDVAADPERVFSMSAEGGDAPFGGPGLDLVKITLKARELRPGEKRKAILTLAIDTSGSMHLEDRLYLVRSSLASLVASLAPEDRVGIVAYSSHAYLVLPHTPAREASRILAAIDSLTPRGESHVEAGLEMAYHLADEIFEPRALNRVILLSDGVATAGSRGPDEILEKVKVYASRGIYLSTVGFGRTRYDDHLMESLADRGNGRYDYVGGPEEAARFFSGSLPGNLEVLARDAKIQVVFDPAVVSHYRLLGYENRDIADEKFRDDTVDAGEVGPGTSVTALYEVRRHPRCHGELGRVHVRYHSTVTSQVEELAFPLSPGILRGASTSDRFRLLAATAETAELLRGAYWARNGSFRAVQSYLESTSAPFQAGREWRELAEVVARAQHLTYRQLAGK